MEVVRFADQYGLLASLYDMTTGDLQRRDRRRGRPVQRWFAVGRNADVAGAVDAWSRPDDRVFLSFVGADFASYRPLADAVSAALGRPVHTMVDAADRDRLEALRVARFATEMVGERFVIRFDTALAQVDRAWIPTGFSIHPADAVDKERLFALDNALRQDVPGTDGWRGDRSWFYEELAEDPAFDPSAYLVAVDDRTDGYVGLARIWRNPDGPKFGLIGALRGYRSVPIAAVLLKQSLTAASRWGHDTFVADTSPSNPVTYPRMDRIGAESLGQFFQMVRG